MTFTEAGKFVLACEIHPFMRGTVKVVDPGVKMRRFAKQEKKGAQQLRKDAKKRAAARQEAGPNKQHGITTSTVAHGHGHKAKAPRRPSSAPAPARSASRCCGSTRPTPGQGRRHRDLEVDGLQRGPHGHDPSSSPILDALAATLFAGPTLDPVGGLPTEAPGAPVVHTDTVHGNGLLGSGIISDPGHDPPNKFMAQFNDAGRLQRTVCLIHDGHGGQSITVTA